MQCKNLLKCHTPQATSTRMSKRHDNKGRWQTQLRFSSTPRSHFGGNSTLYSIASGITADVTVNCDCAHQVGKRVLEGMVGITTVQHTLKKKDQVCYLSNSNTINVRDEVIHIDPQLLFQRPVTAGQCKDNLAEVFQYELCSYPQHCSKTNLPPERPAKLPLLMHCESACLETHQCPVEKSNTFWMEVTCSIYSPGRVATRMEIHVNST